eukprot:scaffold31613_cov45-Phaeocystis_antarctica.AAC.2
MRVCTVAAEGDQGAEDRGGDDRGAGDQGDEGREANAAGPPHPFLPLTSPIVSAPTTHSPKGRT